MRPHKVPKFASRKIVLKGRHRHQVSGRTGFGLGTYERLISHEIFHNPDPNRVGHHMFEIHSIFPKAGETHLLVLNPEPSRSPRPGVVYRHGSPYLIPVVPDVHFKNPEPMSETRSNDLLRTAHFAGRGAGLPISLISHEKGGQVTVSYWKPAGENHVMVGRAHTDITDGVAKLGHLVKDGVIHHE